MHPDTGFKNFLTLYEEYKDKGNIFNEADTRAKIIDFILRDCLGWKEKSIKREENVESGRLDYRLIYQDISLLVIEAKKSGEYFEVPSAMNSRRYKISASISTVPNLNMAFEQVRQYCNDIGCKYAAIANGYQIVVFAAITIGKSWKEGHCYVFHSLEDIKENFALFWNMLAYDQVLEKRSLIEFFEKGKREISFKKVTSEIYNPDQCWARNKLYTYIRPISDFVFSDLLDETRAEVLKQCYVYGRSSSPLIRQMEEYFVDKLPYFAEKYKITDIIESELKAGSFQKKYLVQSFEDQQKNDVAKGSLIVLLGGIGAGKSTFLHRFFKIVISDHENLVWFYVDFKNAPAKETEIETFILDKMLEEWGTKYALKLTQLLEELGFSVDMSDKKIFFSKLFRLLHLLKMSITLIVDNVDRHDVGFQEKIFLTSHHLTDIFKVVTIVSMREETFLLSTRSGVFDAYDTPKFHIASPNFLDMIMKRVEFTLRIISPDKIDKILPRILEKEANELRKYFSIINGSLLRRNMQSRKIVHFIDSVSVGNMREALRMFNSFIVSGNTNIDDIFIKYAQSGSFQIAYHQFVKSIMLGEYRYYIQSRSHITNIFDFDTAIADSHFNLLRILQYLIDRSNQRSIIGRGYVEINELIAVANSVFIPKKVIIDSLLRLSNYNLVEYDNQSITDIESAVFVTLTPAGKYYLTSLLHEFVYLDSVSMDSPISDRYTFSKLHNLANITDLERRLQRTRAFVEYLHQSEIEEYKEHPEYLTNEFTSKKYGSEIAISFRVTEKDIRLSNKLPAA